MTARKYRKNSEEGLIVNPNDFDGDIIIEAWKYLAVSRKDTLLDWVGTLSLVLSLRCDEEYGTC